MLDAADQDYSSQFDKRPFLQISTLREDNQALQDLVQEQTGDLQVYKERYNPLSSGNSEL